MQEMRREALLSVGRAMASDKKGGEEDKRSRRQTLLLRVIAHTGCLMQKGSQTGNPETTRLSLHSGFVFYLASAKSCMREVEVFEIPYQAVYQCLRLSYLRYH